MTYRLAVNEVNILEIEKETNGEMNMKIEHIAIGVIILIASSIVVMAAGTPGNPDIIGPDERIEVESNTVIFLKFQDGDLWTIKLTNEEINYDETFKGEIADMQGKMYSVKFVQEDDETATSGNIYYVPVYGTYKADITVTRGEATVMEVLDAEIVLSEIVE